MQKLPKKIKNLAGLFLLGIKVFFIFFLPVFRILVFLYSIQTGLLLVDMSGFAFWFKTASFLHPKKQHPHNQIQPGDIPCLAMSYYQQVAFSFFSTQNKRNLYHAQSCFFSNPLHTKFFSMFNLLHFMCCNLI